MRKRVHKLVFVMLLCIRMCGISITAFAATEYVDGYLRYTMAEGSVTITGYNGKESEVTIPSKIAGVPVNTIGVGAFTNSSIVTKINLPDTIMTIEEGAFGIGQTVVYNSNTDDTVVTEPTQPTEPTNPPAAEPTQKPTTASTEKPTQDPTTVPTEEPTQDPTTIPTEAPTQVPSQEPGNTDSDKSVSVEEVDVDFEDVSEQEQSVDTTENLKDDDAGEQTIQNADNENKTEDKPSEKSGSKLLIIVVAVIVLAAAIAGICIYRKKGRR